jgi:uncharacterized protein
MMATSKSPTLAYTAPFVVFMLLMAVGPTILEIIPVWPYAPAYIVFPLQTVVCGGLLIYFWNSYKFNGIKYLSVTFAVGFFGFAMWTAPQFFHWIAPRFTGFNPDFFAASPAGYWTTVIMRFIRLVIVVPLLEELFWRGFLMRYLISDRWTEVPFGQFQWKAFSITVLAFTLVHWGSDNFIPGQDFYSAILYGILIGGVACLTKSLGSCVFVHAVTNLFLGLYIMFTKQWGFW